MEKLTREYKIKEAQEVSLGDNVLVNGIKYCVIGIDESNIIPKINLIRCDKELYDEKNSSSINSI